MSRKKVFNGKRLKIARMYRGKTTDVLAKDINVNKKDIIAFEEEKYKPTPENEMKLANALQFPRDYFFQTDNIKVVVDNTHIKPESRIPRVEEISYKEKLVMAHKVLAFIEEYIQFPQMNMPTNLNRNDDIETLAMKVRSHFELGNGPIVNVLNVLEYNGIIVTDANIDVRGALSFSQKQTTDKNTRYIVSLGNDRKSACIRNYDLAYELAYMVSVEATIQAKKFSKDEFACAFLLPEETFLPDLKGINEIEDFVQLKDKWIVPISAMILRAYQLGAIGYKKYMYLMNQMEKQGWTRKEPLDDNIKASSPVLLKKSVDMILESGIMSGATLVDNLANNGLSLYPEEIENLLGLKEGKLAPKAKRDNVTKVNFKNKK